MVVEHRDMVLVVIWGQGARYNDENKGAETVICDENELDNVT